MVIDIAALLVASGLRIVEELVMGMVKAGKSEVPVSQIDASIAREARARADRLQVRVDDLERETHRMFEQLVVSSPELSYAKPRLKSKLTLDYDPKDPASSKEMLVALSARVQRLMPDEAKPTAGGVTVTEVQDESPNRSRQMLDDLQARVQQRESDRK
ncbi:hypothetical protein ACFTSF_07025 [Kribbella sp. NPDC056951]|uniref:hypothetical protein n=1 Tax=Kribbella sp. NPDC056951 TaxID=3345978 RepID=UPI00362CDE0B